MPSKLPSPTTMQGGCTGQAGCCGHHARATDRQPVFEQILVDGSDSFVWKVDDYPLKTAVWNVHQECEIHLIRNVSGIALVGDYIGEFKPGHLAIIGSGLPHDWVTAIAPGESLCGRDVVLQFDPDRLRKAAAALPELAAVVSFRALSGRGLSFYGETRWIGAKLLEEMGQAHGLDRLSLFLRLLGLLASCREYKILSSENFVPNLAPATVEIVQRVMTYVLANFTTDIRLSDLADMVGMSESTFSRFFQKNIGNSFTDHVMKLRLGRACKLLTDSDMAITDICFEVGYSNISNFNRNFRQQRGITPSSYRRFATRRVF